MEKKKILVAPNSFKGCADSVTIAKLIESHLRPMHKYELIVKPISDGGDGFLKVCEFYFGGEYRTYSITAPYDASKFDCSVLYSKEKKEIYIESAEVLGLKKVPANFRKPLNLSSKGMGELLKLIQHDIDERLITVDKVTIGIGGTATVDLGLGMMSELGLTLFGNEQDKIDMLPRNYLEVTDVTYEKYNFEFKIILISDVDNSLLGQDSGLRIYSQQKGASESDIQTLEKGFEHLINLFENKGLSISSSFLSGAGGGILAAFQIFYGLKVLSSNQFILENLGFEEFKADLDYIITGEGAYDSQSAFGKGANMIIQKYVENAKRIFLICGVIDRKIINSIQDNAYPIELYRYFNSVADSIKNYKLGIKLACNEILTQI